MDASSKEQTTIAHITRFRDQNGTPLASFHGPRAARPEKATRPITEAMSIAEGNQDLLRTAKMTKVSPSRRYVRETRVRRETMRLRRGTCVATTTDVMGEGEG